MKYMIWKYLLSTCKLPFDFVDVPFFGVWCGPTCLFLQLLPLLLVWDPKTHWSTLLIYVSVFMPVNQYETCFLLCLLNISFMSVLNIFLHRSFNTLLKFISNYFNFFDAIINGIICISVIFLVYGKVPEFYIFKCNIQNICYFLQNR